MLHHLLIGTSGTALHQLAFDPTHATLSIVNSLQVQAPTWVTFDPLTHAILANSEIESAPHGALSLFPALPTNLGTEVAWQPSPSWTAQTTTNGTAYCSIAYRGNKPFYMAANYAGGTADVFDAQGKLTDTRAYHGSGPFPGRQLASHAHQIIEDLSREFVYVCDLGGDQVHVYHLDESGKLHDQKSIRLDPGQGPRHVAFNPDHKDLVYVICELTNDVVLFRRTGKTWQRVQTVKLLDDKVAKVKAPRFHQPPSAAAILITADAQQLLASVRYIAGKEDADILVSIQLGGDGLMEVAIMKTYNTHAVGPRALALSGDTKQRYIAATFKETGSVRVYDRLDSSFKLVAQLDIKGASSAIFI